MVTRTKDQNTYIHGSWNIICDVCGFKFKQEDIKKRWDGLRVCADDWEIRHEQDFLRGVKDDPHVPYTRPDQAESGGVDILGNSFPPPENTDATSHGHKPDADEDGLVEGHFLKDGEIDPSTTP